MGSIKFNVGFRGDERDEIGFKLKGLAVPIEINSNNYDIKANFDLSVIEESIHNIFHWYKGERILNPEFGNPILEYIYEPINNITAKNIGSTITNAINLWDSRISIKQLNIVPDEDNNQYSITLLYDVPILNLYNVDYNKIITIED